MLIAIDTATTYLGLALYADTLIAEQMWRTGNQHNLILAPAIQDLLKTCDLSPSEITMVAVANGPGSYTGLRIGIALAKGLAAVRNLPLIGINTLDIIAAGQTFTNAKHRLLCILPAGRGRIIAGEYRVKKGRWDAAAAPQICTWEELFATLDAPSYYVAGELDAQGLAAIKAFHHPEVSLMLVDTANRNRRLAILAQEAWQRYHKGEAGDFVAAKLAPIYLNSPG